jgi:diadenosine tetraphosphate (Ap4A) HIT family hydrolase
MLLAHTVDDAASETSACSNAHFRIEPCVSCPIAGYFIVSPRVPVSSLSQLCSEAQASLGPTLAAVTRAIEVVVRPKRVYCLLFAEETPSVHFHLFPRADWLLSQYARCHPTDGQISGPRLLDWARQTFRSPVSADYHQTTQAILRAIDRNI